MTPLFPPHEICVQGGSNPLIGHLVRPINVLYADLTVSNLVLYRYHAPTFEWIHFFSPLPSGSKALNKNITQAPYNIREGDLFAVFSMQEAASPIISSRSTSKSKLAPRDQNTAIEVEISSPEDMQLKKLREEAKRKKEEQDQQEKEQQVGGKDGKKGKAKHRPEQALVIHSHLDDDFDDN